MAQVVYSGHAVEDLERRFELLTVEDADAAVRGANAIRSAVEMLAHHPMIGRIVRSDIRELVISFGRTGYVALYEHVLATDVVYVLRIRHQRELDYP